jgi:hypothetical protein
MKDPTPSHAEDLFTDDLNTKSFAVSCPFVWFSALQHLVFLETTVNSVGERTEIQVFQVRKTNVIFGFMREKGTMNRSLGLDRTAYTSMLSYNS